MSPNFVGAFHFLGRFRLPAGRFIDVFMGNFVLQLQTDRAGYVTSLSVLKEAAETLQARFPGGGFAKKVLDTERLVAETIRRDK